MDLSAIYSKTPKGLRARASLIGGLSSHLMKVLTHVDGSARAETILLKFDKLTPQQLSADLSRLEHEGYIRLATVTSDTDSSWALTVNFEPMVVEEYQSEEELDNSDQAKSAEKIRKLEQQQAQQRAEQEEQRRLAAQLKANKKAEKLRQKEKSKAEIKVKALLEQERIAHEAAKSAEAARLKIEAEAKLIAQQEATRVAEQQAADRAAKLTEEMARKTALKAREAAEQAEIDAEEKAKQQAYREIERISREVEEAQKKADAEAKAKLEDERLEALNIAKAAEAEQLKQAEVAAQEVALKQKLAQAEKETSRLEIAAVLRKAEEDRKNAVAQAKAEKLEAKRQARAEQEARALADSKAKEEAKELAKQQKLKAQAEEQARAEAANQARLDAARIAEATEIAREKALENEQLQAQQAAEALAAQAEVAHKQRVEGEHQEQLVAEAMLAHLLADEQANAATKQNAQLEMERIGREAEQARQKFVQQDKASTQYKTTQQLETTEQPKTSATLPLLEIQKSAPDDDLIDLKYFEATEAAEEAAFEAEEQATEDSVRFTSEKTAKQAKIHADGSDIKNKAKTEAAAMANMRGTRQSHLSAKKIRQWLGSISKVMFIYVPVLLLVLVLLLHFVNLSALIKPIEKIAGDSIGESVQIKKVHASLWPQPHLVLEEVVIAGANSIEAVHVLPDTESLFEEVKVVKSLVIEGLSIEQVNFGQPIQWVNNFSKAKNLKVEQINLNNITLAIRDLQLESFDGKVTLTDAGALSSIALVSSNNALSVNISPQGVNNQIVLQATNWALPFNQKIVFGALNAKGLASQNQINFSEIKAEIFGGSMTGQADIKWPNGKGVWFSSGEFKLSNANVEALLKNFGSAVTIDGKLAMDARFSGKAPEASKLANATITSASFDVRQGSIQGIELARAVLSPGKHSLAGNDTDFNKLTGSAKFDQNQYQFGKLVLASPQFSANGYININANQILTGRVNADLAAQSRRLKANFGITGRGADLKSN